VRKPGLLRFDEKNLKKWQRGETGYPIMDAGMPELKALPKKLIHTPWLYEGPLDYPPPMVDHAEARKVALAAYKKL